MTFGRRTPVGQERELEGLAVDDDGVAGVGPAVVADDEVELVAEQIDDLPLGLVAPLQADHARAGHFDPVRVLPEVAAAIANCQKKRPGRKPGRVGP